MLLQVQGSRNNRGVSDVPSYTYVGKHFIGNKCIKFYGISEREVGIDDI